MSFGRVNYYFDLTYWFVILNNYGHSCLLNHFIRTYLFCPSPLNYHLKQLWAWMSFAIQPKLTYFIIFVFILFFHRPLLTYLYACYPSLSSFGSHFPTPSLSLSLSLWYHIVRSHFHKKMILCIFLLSYEKFTNSLFNIKISQYYHNSLNIIKIDEDMASTRLWNADSIKFPLV